METNTSIYKKLVGEAQHWRKLKLAKYADMNGIIYNINTEKWQPQ